MKRGQTYSMDLLIGLMVFLVMFIGFFLLISVISKPAKSTLHNEAVNILNKVSSGTENISFVDRSAISEEDLRALAGRDYEEIKELINANKDFCIYLEDENGTVMPIAFHDSYVIGLGSSNMTIGNMTCGVAYR